MFNNHWNLLFTYSDAKKVFKELANIRNTGQIYFPGITKVEVKKFFKILKDFLSTVFLSLCLLSDKLNKMRQIFYYKMGQSLKIATILLQNAIAVTKCNVYYKLRQYKR